MHPAFKRYSEDKVEWEQAILFFTNGSLAYEIKKKEVHALEDAIAAIDLLRHLNKSISLKIVSKKNNLKKKLLSEREEIEDLRNRLDIAEIYFVSYNDKFIN